MHDSLSYPAHVCYGSSTTSDSISFALRAGGAALIFCVSLLASSFPFLGKCAPTIEPPLILFFMGKHFGTGVILSTAFVHLLQEGFEKLLDPCINGSWKKWTGFTVLSSFLLIFLIEYISTVFVEHLSSSEMEASHARLHTSEPLSTPYLDDPDAESPLLGEPQGNGHANPSHFIHVEETSDAASSRRPLARRFFRWHHRHESPHSHTHMAGPRISKPQDIATVFFTDHEADGLPRVSNLESEPRNEPTHEDHREGDGLSGEISRKTRIISILVLQLGIMVHSVVIGLTLSITSGSKFTSLFIAIIFHQLFEGLSLGIRIASLPPGGRAAYILPGILCILFALAAPLGFSFGVWLLPSVSQSLGQSSAMHVFIAAQLTKGLMCTVSAGMLIYAAAVEMLAGDFVLDPEMRRNGFWMQVLALGSLITGSTAMAILGWS